LIKVISENPEVVLILLPALVAILAYFIRRVLNSIDSHTSMINSIRLDLVTQLSNAMSKLREDMTAVFNDTCSERQGSCSRLQQAKLDILQATHTAICAKLGRLDVERKEVWAEQRRWNDKVETIVYKANDK
jgi:hypothetical protein